MLHDQVGEEGADKRAQGASPRDEAEQATALLVGEHVGHEAPEDTHYHQVEHAQPDEERAAGVDLVLRPEPEQAREDEQVHREKVVDHRDEHAPAEALDQEPVGRHGRQHDHEGAGEEPVELLDPAGNAQASRTGLST